MLLNNAFLGLMMGFHGSAMTLAMTGRLSLLMKNQKILTEDYKLSDFEEHLLFIIGGALHGTMLVGGIVALTTTTAKDNGAAREARVGNMLAMESVLTSAITVGNYIHGFPYHQSAAVAALSLGGTIFHFFVDGHEKTTKAS